MNRREFMAVGAGALAALPIAAQDDGGLIVHEWGVVTIAYGTTRGFARSEGSRFVEGVEKPEELPEFVVTLQKALDGAIEDWKNMPVRKPIVYFHAKRRMNVDVRVAIPKGRPHAWWPPVTDLAPKANLRPRGGKGGDEPKLPTIADLPAENGAIVWRNVTLDADEKKFEPAKGWWATARETASTPVSVNGRSDKFLFYDALTRVDAGLEIAWARDGKVTITSRDAVTLFAIHVKDGTCFSATLAMAKGEAKELAPTEGKPDLAKPLVAAGLCADEVAALIKIWTDEFFEANGARVLAILPRETYDALLPIEITPKPAELKRVLIAHLECLDPTAQARVDAWIAALGSENLEERDTATKGLRRFGPLAEKSIRDAIERSKDAESKSRLQELLKR